ncbi:hypothetical protein F4703DRAFT_1850187 [Phycomyces blakesleeanus]
MDAAEEEKGKNKWIIEQLKLEPFSLIYRDHNNNIVEYNALSHHNNIRGMSDHTFECKPIIPSKRLFDGNVVEQSFCANLTSLIHRSPHRGMLSGRQYFELDKKTALLLNKDWTHEPHIKFGCVQVLAGSILMNVNNGEAILVNTVETYGRTKSVDIHRELSTSATSSILTTTPMYPNIWPCIQSTRDGSKLVIGTQSCDCLITSIVRLDRNEKPKVGPLSFYFAASPQHTRIFIDQDSWEKAKEIESNTSIRSVEPFNLVGQARQLRSHFHHPSTYFLCRASSHLALPHYCQPYTVFTYCDHEGVKKSMDNESSSVIASKLFQRIAYTVIKSPSEASIKKDLVVSLHGQCNNDSKIKNLFTDLIMLFGNCTEMPIIGNMELNNCVLKNMANIISPDICKANETVAANIQRRLCTY